MLSKVPGGGRAVSFSGSTPGKGITLPCGRCIGCRLERSRQWAVRIMHESKLHDSNSFVTLTYDDEHLPSDRSLSVKHVQLFMKRFRFSLGAQKLRFFLCGEYGEKLGRPHYHAILFGWFPSDPVVVKDAAEHSLWSSKQLSDAWGMGFASVGRVTFESASYVANYATKKITGPSAAEHYQGRRPEFLLMSRRPGLGRPWFDKFGADVYPSDQVIVRGVPCRPPRYYDQLQEAQDPGMMEQLKLKREAAADRLEEMVLDCGTVNVVLSRNGRRLPACEAVAKAKLSLKSRSLEKPSC